MGFATALSVLAMVGSLLVGILAGFPVSDSGLLPSQEDAVAGEIFGDKSVRLGATKFAGVYTSVLDELASFQRHPDSRRAEVRWQEMTEYALTAADSLNTFANMFEGKLRELTAEGDAQGG